MEHQRMFSFWGFGFGRLHKTKNAWALARFYLHSVEYVMEFHVS